MKKLPTYITINEFKKIIDIERKPCYKIAFILGFNSGLRVSEVINLKKENIFIEEKKIMIKSGKGNKDRIVPLPKGFTEKSLKFIPIGLTIRSLQREFKICLIKARIDKPATFHSLRHGFANRCIEQGIPIHQVQLLMGHARLETTGIYLHANPADALLNYEEMF